MAYSSDDDTTIEAPKSGITASSITIGAADIDTPFPPIIGVEIGDSAYTEYTFEAGDQIRLVSEKGLNVILTAESSGKEDIRFVGNFEPVAETDTYWAICPATYELQPDGTFHVSDYYAYQTGKDQDVVLMGAHAENISGEDLHLEFYPINTLLHVAIENGLDQYDYATFEPNSGGLITSGTYYIDYNGYGPTFYYDDTLNYAYDKRSWSDGALEERFMKFFWYDISNGNQLLTDNTKWYGHNGVGLHAAMFRWAQILSPEFHLPEAIRIQAEWNVEVTYTGVELGMEFSTIAGDDSDEDLLTANLDSGEELTQSSDVVLFRPKYPCLQIEHRSAEVLPSSTVNWLKVLYAE